MGIRFDEFGNEIIEETEEIVEYQYLSVTMWTGSDPDRGDQQLCRDVLRQRSRNGFDT